MRMALEIPPENLRMIQMIHGNHLVQEWDRRRRTLLPFLTGGASQLLNRLIARDREREARKPSDMVHTIAAITERDIETIFGS